MAAQKKTKSKKKSKAEPRGFKPTVEVMRGVLTKSRKGDDVIRQIFAEPFSKDIQSMSCELRHNEYSNWKKSKRATK